MYFLLQVLEELSVLGKLDHLRALDINYTVGLTENVIYNFLIKHGKTLEGLMIAGKPKLAEQFFLNIIPFIKNMRYIY